MSTARIRLNDREKLQPWRRWYHSAEWKRLRLRVLERDLFTCKLCGKIELNTSRLIGDHKVPHHGNRSDFFNANNVWCLCKACHDGRKQKLDKSGVLIGSDADGRPVDPAHPWNGGRLVNSGTASAQRRV